MTDVELGRQALRQFHNSSLGYQAYTPQTVDELAGLYGSKRDIYLDGIGGVVRELGMNEYQVADAMEKLAEKSEGKIPRDHQGYIAALGSKASQISYLDLSKTVASDVAQGVVKGAVAVGTSVTTTLSWLTSMLPYLAVGGVIFYIYSFGKNNSKISGATISKAKAGARKFKAAVKKKISST